MGAPGQVTRVKCVICRQIFNDYAQAQQVACGPGQGHMLQEMINGAWNDDTKERADFIAADERDLKKWGEDAKKLGYDID